MGKMRDHLLPVVKLKALKYHLDEKLMDAIIQVESNYNFYAVRFEAKTDYLNNPARFAKLNFTTISSEQTLQHFSWGLFQIMGFLARDLEFLGPMPSLCDVDTNLELGCKFLSKLGKKYHSVTDIISAFNAGVPAKDPSTGKYINQLYVDKVLEKMNENIPSS